MTWITAWAAEAFEKQIRRCHFAFAFRKLDVFQWGIRLELCAFKVFRDADFAQLFLTFNRCMKIEFRWLTILMRVQLRKVRQRQLKIKYSFTSWQLLDHINLYLHGLLWLNNPQFDALKFMLQHFCCFGSNLDRILHRLRSRLPL